MKFYIKIFLQRMIAIAILPLHIFPVKKNRILFLSLEGGSHCEYSCNPRYLCEYILPRKAPDTELVWLFRRPEDYSDLPSEIRTARHFTPRGFYYCLTSGIVITNGGYLTWFPFRRSQIRINTWHGGGAYKKMENDRAGANRATERRMDYMSRNTTAFVSSSEKFTEFAIRGAFRFRGEVLSCGMPRNDIIFSSESETWYRKIRERYHLPENARLLLYAPTFREQADITEIPDCERIRRSLPAEKDREWFILLRTHVKAGKQDVLSHPTDHCIDVSDYPDTQHLICASDLLVSDYSSIIWDFCLTGRPIVLYTPDLKQYTDKQGFYVDIHRWGFPLSECPEELYRLLSDVSFHAEDNGSLNHQLLLGSYEHGNACRKVWEYICSALH